MAHSTPAHGDSPAIPNMIITTSTSALRKRKREDEKSVLGNSFIIKPHTSSAFDSSVKLTPAVTLPRSYIPLQWLAGYPSRLFSIPIHIPALDVPGNAIIVKVEGERQLAVVEKVEGNVCTLYKLSTQVKMKGVRETALLVRKSVQNSEGVFEIDPPSEILSSEWWSSLEVPYFDTNNAICAIESTVKLIMGSSNYSDGALLLPPSPPPQPPNIPPSPPVTTDTALERIQNFPEPTLADILEKTRVQYFQTLYVAKTSLAYFAKSTLSRARVAVQQENGLLPSPDPGNELRAFLLEMYLPFDKMDTKYRISIVQIATEETVDDVTVFRVGEEEYIQQWRVATWEEKLVQPNDPTMKRKVEELKIRETELQIIILLEILALEREQAASAKESPNEDRSYKKRCKKGDKKGKKRSKINSPDPKLLLDLLVDRLCIWRSIGSGPNEIEEESSSQKKVTDREHDHLRHFCVEVVLAFYASRLPEECASINKKCGGSNSRPRTPGHPKKEKNSQTKKPPILRAITSSISTREASVDTLAALITADTASVPRGTIRGGTLNYKSFAKREIQITSRNGKQKKVDEELRDAINALKKPNRITAASELVDESTKRVSNCKKTKKPARNPLAKVQVMATPKRRRTIIPPQPSPPPVAGVSYDSRAYDQFYIPRVSGPNSLHDIPGTPLQRYGRMNSDKISSTSPFGIPPEVRRATTFPDSFVTPQKKQRRSMGTDLGTGNFVPSSTTKVAETLPRTSASLVAPPRGSKLMSQNPFDPVDDVSSPVGGVMLYNDDAIGETPCKATAITPVAKLLTKKKEISIYDSLGWDDDYDL